MRVPFKGSYKGSVGFRVEGLGVSENGGALFWGPFHKDPTI